MQHTVFGHLASRFSSSPENLATEALNFVLGRSHTARRALLQYLGHLGPTLPPDLVFLTQAGGEDTAIPDLVGIDADGDQVLVVESKFWAGLTDNQPVAYLHRLPPGKAGVLIFLAPDRRLAMLGPELVRRCREAGIRLEYDGSRRELLVAAIGDRHYLALASWRSVLTVIQRALETEGEHDVAADVRQLQGLCEQMDEDAFLPVRSEELTSTIGTRLVQFNGLIDDVTAHLVERGLASVQGLRAAAGSAWYGRYLMLLGTPCLLKVDCRLWATQRVTPLWLSVYGPDWEYSHTIHEALRPLELEDPPRLLRQDKALLVPLYIVTGAERDEVIANLVQQVLEVAGCWQDST